MTAGPQIADLTGRRFGRLVVTGFACKKPGKKNTFWHCVCDCGGRCEVRGLTLKRGEKRSCGCAVQPRPRAPRVLVRHVETHGMSGSPEWRTWATMKKRCANAKDRRYGGRGIKVCDRWRGSFRAFLADMGPKPGPDYSIDRKDNDGDYEPGNCVWADRFTQANNKRNSVLLEYEGKRQTVAQWARETGLDAKVIRHRLQKGLPACAVLEASHA